METKDNYHISFFKPTTPQAKANRNMVGWLVLVWAVAIFGFHFLLRVIEKPTDEPSLVDYNQYKEKVYSATANKTEKQAFFAALMSVSAKTSADAIPELNNAIAYHVLQNVDSADNVSISSSLSKISDLNASIAGLNKEKEGLDKEDKEKSESLAKEIAGKNAEIDAIVADLVPVCAKYSTDLLGDDKFKVVKTQAIPYALDKLPGDNYPSAGKLDDIMVKYLRHNQSVLTDTKFLGFPFHYFYTAVFLLILFIGLCYIYCVRIDNLNKKHEIED